MEPRCRRAASTYLETFILVGVALGGSALVFVATNRYPAVEQGPSVALSNTVLQQGLSAATEKMVIANTGTVAFGSFTISTAGIPPNQFYITLTNAATRAPIPPSPASGTSPGSITETVNVSPGQSVIVSVAILGASEFSIGATYSILVSTPAGAQVSGSAVAIPA